MNKRVQFLKTTLQLNEHPEGGYFKETYRSEGQISQSELSDTFNGSRNYCTGIYFLLTSENFSAFHRIKQDEMWHHYEGDALTVHMINSQGQYSAQQVGSNIGNGELPQFVVPRDVWFASEVTEGGTYSLVGCTVSPGFDFQDFELADRNKLVSEFPEHSDVIKKLTQIER